jgi:NCAIR mutase (PurE)-related protein
MKNTISDHIKRLKSGELSEEEFLKFVENVPYENMGDIKLDFHRKLRRGVPEAIYGSGKTPEQLEKIIHGFTHKSEDILITRVEKEKFQQLAALCPDTGLVYHEKARIVTFDKKPEVRFKGSIMVVSAGSSDEPVADEAYVSALYLGNKVDKAYDVGVACISRVIDLKNTFNQYTVLIVVAGMEGALPSVVAGLTATPVIAVPTSIGYGANFGGLSALLSMLNTCSGGVSVVNIDNGFGAAYMASLICQKVNN